jgi:hypothetical protein
MGNKVPPGLSKLDRNGAISNASCAFVANRIKSNLSACAYSSIAATWTESAVAVPPMPDTRRPDDRSTLADSAVRVASQTGSPALTARVAIVPPNAPIPTIRIRIRWFSLMHLIMTLALLHTNLPAPGESIGSSHSTIRSEEVGPSVSKRIAIFSVQQ